MPPLAENSPATDGAAPPPAPKLFLKYSKRWPSILSLIHIGFEGVPVLVDLTPIFSSLSFGNGATGFAHSTYG